VRKWIIALILERLHLELLEYLLNIVSPSLLSAQNNAGSTPLHWAALNGHLRIMQLLVDHPGGPGQGLIELKSAAGRSPLGEAELAGFEEGAKWLVERMKLEVQQSINEEV
jgi:ankyrin repeat protein